MGIKDRLSFAAGCVALLLCAVNVAYAADAPSGGTPAAIPGTVLAEKYDTGGQGSAYNVASVNGTDNGYRPDGVDLQTTTATGGGNDMGWTAAGQWFKYTVNVATAGTYIVTFEVAAESAVSDAFHVSNSTGTNLSGPVAVPDTGGWQDWVTVTATVTLPAGTQTLTIDQDNGGWNIYSAAFVAATSSEAPYGGTPAPVPGTVDASNYDTGGQGIAYIVTSVNGTADSYRSDGVDLEVASDTTGGYDLGWTSAGQWFRYTVDVATAGVYNVTFRVAAPTAVTDGLHISNSSGTDLSGSVNIPETGGWGDWADVTATVTLPAGEQVLTVNQDNAGWNVNYLEFVPVETGGEEPYGGTPVVIPGTVLAENYDTGGQGAGYNVASVNGSDNSYRSDGVDLETTSAPGGGNDLGWTASGQWFKYSISVADAGKYTVSFEVAAPNAVTDAFHLSNSSGTNLTGSINVPATGGYQAWTTVTATVTLPAGEQVLTLNQDNGGWNIDDFAFSTGSGVTAGNVFAPFEYLGDLNDANQLPGILSGSGAKAVILAFLVPQSNECDLAWGGVNGALPDDTLGSTSVGTEIAALQAKGITVAISSGGAGGQDGSAYCSTAAETQALYQSVIDQYHVTWLDFDLENPQTSGQPARRAQALAALQKANPGLVISYTLPLGTGGLNNGDNGTTDLADAKSAGLNLNIVNGMAMDFGNEGADQATEAEEGTAAEEQQVKAAGLTSTIGITVLPGTSDDDPPVYFTLANATTVLNWAKANSYVTLLSFWELNRDNGGCPGSTTDEDTCSGVSQSNYEFSSIFDVF
ncbi:uncharacterized protein involved in high-affinity Fe2+ transport [Silvibacterium bohemicum]|uniref:Uncharacterized protein involved in high-affinity Fe2+ transport n=1 Tax=Silvibacterium bohemicum TaxID=1577686 RepID=A0A841JUM3_9BACT|nr:carbohydrate-binding protein [Silvibacterium bohemicum]MBB6145093.1 uncharacterized protein involved in high-affinity Fe2+ transport [Silvibacterium bohemicum]